MISKMLMPLIYILELILYKAANFFSGRPVVTLCHAFGYRGGVVVVSGGLSDTQILNSQPPVVFLSCLLIVWQDIPQEITFESVFGHIIWARHLMR